MLIISTLTVKRKTGVGGWCPSEDALHSGSISTSSAVQIEQKAGDGGDIGGVSGSSSAGASERRDGRPEGELQPEEQVSLMGEAVSGRSVQRKEGEKQPIWGVSGCGTHRLVLHSRVCVFMRESLRKITHTLATKNEEISNFICSLKQSLDNLEANSSRVQEDLESEFTSLQSVLDDMKESMVTRIKQERASRTYEIQSQLSACSKALESSEELLELANQTLCSSETDGFTQAAKDIKDSVTMAPAFRLSLKAKAGDNMSHLMVDFSQEREMLQGLKFLPVPATPEIQVSECQVCDNTVTVLWTLPEPDSKIDHYILEHRRTNHEGPPRIREDYPWMVVEGIREMEHTLTGLRFDTRYITFRVRACNKAVAGEFSEPVTLETHAFTFKLDSGSSHQNLKVEDLSVEWDSSGGKIQEIRKEKNRTNSPMHSPARSALMSPKRAPTARPGRDRFTAESYTVLADTMIDAGQQYWEVRFDKESKAFAVGVALRSLGRFDQLGKSSASWCIHLNNWLQQSLTAKHNNKARTLDCPIPSSIGVYCNYEEGEEKQTRRYSTISLFIAVLLLKNMPQMTRCSVFLQFQNEATDAHLQNQVPAASYTGFHGVERQFLCSDGPAGSQRGAKWPEEEQRHKQLQRQPHLDSPSWMPPSSAHGCGQSDIMEE
ncbi:hypothetical protein PAMP_024650 [Pampus punctatissimus]